MNLFSQIGTLGASIVCGWLARGFLLTHPAPPPIDTPPPIPAQADLTGDRLDICVSLARELPSANSRTLHRYASQLLETQPDDKPIWSALFERWIRIDPNAAWTFASTQIDQEEHPSIFLLAISRWASIDPRAAHQALVNPSPKQLSAILKEAMSSDPAFAFSVLDGVTSALEGERSIPWEKWIFDLARSNPSGVENWLNQREKNDLFGAYLAGLAVTDQAAALRWLRSQKDQDLVFTQLGNFIGYGDHVEYNAELIDFTSEVLPIGNRRLVVLKRALENLSYKDTEMAISEVKRVFIDPWQQAEVLTEIAENHRRKDFQKAWKIVQEIDPKVLWLRRVAIPKIEITQGGVTKDHGGPFGYQWDMTSMRGLVEPAVIKSQMLADLLVVDRSAALSYLSNLPPDQILPIAGNGAFQQWVRYEPQEAIHWLANTLPQSVDQDQLDRLLDDSYFPAQEARDAFPRLPESNIKLALIDLVAGEIADESPASAIQFLQQEGGSEEAVEWAYFSYAYDDPAQALEALRNDSEAGPESWETVIERAIKVTPDAAIEAVIALPAGRARDLSTSEIAKYYSNEADPVTATDWALGIDDPKLRQASFDAIIDHTTMDLRMARDAELKGELSQLISSEHSLSGAQKAQWLDRLETEFTTR